MGTALFGRNTVSQSLYRFFFVWVSLGVSQEQFLNVEGLSGIAKNLHSLVRKHLSELTLGYIFRLFIYNPLK